MEGPGAYDHCWKTHKILGKRNPRQYLRYHATEMRIAGARRPDNVTAETFMVVLDGFAYHYQERLPDE